VIVMTSSRARSPLPVALALLLVPVLAALAGCGGDEPVVLEGRTLRVALDEYRLVPQDVEMTAGRVRLEAVNRGRLTHNLRVVQQDPENAEAPPEEIGGTRTAQPGELATAAVEDLPAGRYRIVCTIANHDDLGMRGELTLVEP
jgi:plastocyanin